MKTVPATRELSQRHQTMIQAIWRHQRLSQSQLHRLLGIRKNTVSEDVIELLALGLIRATGSERLSRGRPLTPLEIDPDRRHVLGLTIQAGRVELAKLNLLGELQDKPIERRVASFPSLVRTARDLLARHVTKETLAAGIATPGLLDGGRQEILFSSIHPDERVVSLRPLFESLNGLPIVIENDVHAIAARWLLVNRSSDEETVLLVFLDDGQVGAAVLVEGHPVPGCIIGAHELGHMRLNVETKRCYCGEVGCLERIFSSEFVRPKGVRGGLKKIASTFDGRDPAVKRMLELTAGGIANAINLLRPHRLTLVGEVIRPGSFADTLVNAVRRFTLAELVVRVKIDVWDQPANRSAETAAWLALASLYHRGWRLPRVNN